MTYTSGEPAAFGRPESFLRMAQLLMGSRIAMALRVVVERNIPDLLGDDTRSTNQLSLHTGIPARSLTRLMRSLSYVGVFHEDEHGQFRNNEASTYLRNDSDQSLRPMSLILNHDAVLRGWQDLDRVLETGAPAFPEVNGQHFFQHLASDSERSENMTRFMKGSYGPEGPRIAAGFPFSRFGRLIDIGGGGGNILADILRAHPMVKGALFELPKTADVARRYLSEQGLADRSEVFSGDFLDEVTPGYDAYFIKSVLHNWDDDHAVRILNNCCKAMPSHGCILLAEIVIVPGKPMGHPHPFIDMEMMVTLGGRERTVEDFGELFRRASLRLEDIHPVNGSFLSVLEASKA